MTKLIKTTDLPSTLDALELMEVRGGEHDQNPGTNHFCIFTSAIKLYVLEEELWFNALEGVPLKCKTRLRCVVLSKKLTKIS